MPLTEAMDTTRTETGLLEWHLENAQAMETLVNKRLAAPQSPTARERELAEQIRRQAVGLQRLFRRWIRLHVEEERV